MDDLFARTFQQQHHPRGSGGGTVQQAPPQPAKKSWGRWIADCLGVDLHISTSTTRLGPDGRPMTSRTQTHYGGGNHPPHGHASTTTSRYTSKSTRTVIENGQRVTIQSLEQDGNKIEERYMNNQLQQRLINGVPEHQYRLHAGGDL